MTATVTPPAREPYQRAAQEWDNRIGSAVVQAKNWRMAAFGALGLAALSLGGFIYQSSNTHVANLCGAGRQVWPSGAHRAGGPVLHAVHRRGPATSWPTG